MDLLPLAITSIQAILQVACTCVFGFVLMKKGMITKDLHKGLANINVNFFTPCLLFSKMAANASLTTYISMWPIPIIYFAIFIVSLVISNLGSKALGLNDSMRRFVTLSSVFSNSNSLPISLIQSIALSSVAHHLLWDEDDTLDEIEGRGITYIVIFAAISNIVRWSYGVNLLTSSDSDQPLSKDVETTVESGLIQQGITENTPLMQSVPPTDLTFFQKLSLLTSSALAGFWSALNPPLIAIFAALLVGAIAPLKAIFYGPSPIFGAFSNAIRVCGGASIPIVLIGLGCNIAMLVQDSRQINLRMVGLVVVSRFILVPLIVISLLLLAQPWFYLGDDPVFILTMMILISTPTAINMLNVCQSVNKFEDEMAMLLLYSYALCVPVMTALVTFYLYLIKSIPF